MNNLVPEKRMDKTGKLVTRHVRNGSPAAPSKTLGTVAPSLPSGAVRAALKLPTITQLRAKRRNIRITKSDCDPELLKRVALPSYSRMIECSDMEMYDVASVVKGGMNAMLLMHRDIRTGDEAEKYLESNGLSHLVSDDSEMIEEAIGRRIPAEVYIKKEVMRLHHATEHLMDALETAGSSAHELTGDVLHGNIRLDDIKTVGMNRLKKCLDGKSVRNVLRILAAGTDRFTAEDVAKAIDKSPGSTSLVHRFDLLTRHGAEVAFNVRGSISIAARVSSALDERGNTDDEYAKGVILYSASLYMQYLDRWGASQTKLPNEDLFAFYDSGTSIDDVVSRRITADQARAVIDGSVGGAVASGWL